MQDAHTRGYYARRVHNREEEAVFRPRVAGVAVTGLRRRATGVYGSEEVDLCSWVMSEMSIHAIADRR